MMKIVIFGGSGDLAKRILIPSLSKIDTTKVQVISFARSPLKDIYALELRKYYKYDNDFPEKVIYIKGSYTDLSSLHNIVDKNTIFYFSVPPEIYLDLLGEISKFDFKAIGIEKPFGTDHNSFLKLACFNKNKIYFIDHYLLKPLIISLPLIFKQNPKIINLLNNQHIELIEACFNESILAKGRAYFDKTGIVKDVMQNHLMVILGSILSFPLKNNSNSE